MEAHVIAKTLACETHLRSFGNLNERLSMTGEMLFSLYLQRHLMRSDVTVAQLARRLGFKNNFTVERWLHADDMPPPCFLPLIGAALGVDAVELSVGWLIANCPGYEEILQDQVLEPREADFPRFP